MADYCMQCSTEMFGEDYKDMKGISKPIHTLYKRYPVVLCEGCGATQVDHTGKCIHHEKEEHMDRTQNPWYELDDEEMEGWDIL